jgi:hypothetical protein
MAAATRMKKTWHQCAGDMDVIRAMRPRVPGSSIPELRGFRTQMEQSSFSVPENR